MGGVSDKYRHIKRAEYPMAERVLLVLLAVAYPFHFPMPTPAGSINTSYGDPLVGLVCVLFVVGVLGVNRRALLRYAIPVVLFVVVALVSLAANVYISPLSETYDPFTGLVEIVKFGGGVAWMVAAYALLARSPAERLRDFAAVSLILALGSVFFALLAAAVGGYSVARPTGPFVGTNIYAHYLISNIALGAYLVAYYARPALVDISVVSHRRVRQFLLWIVLPIIISGLVTTGSRGALLGFAVGAIVLAVLTIRHISLTGIQAGLHAVIYAAYALLGAIFLSVFVPRMADRFIETLTEGGGENSSTRIENWETAWGAFRENPLLGIGYGQYPEYMAVVMPRHAGVFAHNTYMTTLAQMGVIGLIVLLAFVALLVRDGWVLTQRHRVVVAAPIVAVIIGTFAQGLVADVDNFRSLWIAIGTLAAFYGSVRNQNTEAAPEMTQLKRSQHEQIEAAQ